MAIDNANAGPDPAASASSASVSNASVSNASVSNASVSNATVLARLRAHAEERPDAPAFAVRGDGGWVATPWRDYHRQVCRVARALLALGVEPGGTVGILGFNRPEWAASALGAMAAGGAPAGIYQTCSAEQVGFVLRHAGSAVAVVENEEQWRKVREVRDRLPALRRVVVMAGVVPEDDPGTLDWQSFLACAEEVPEAALDERLAAVGPESLATVIYTSGTTGDPKGVMLTHANLFETSRICRPLLGLESPDRALSYLPLAHIAEQMISVHMAAYTGYAVYYAESPERLADNLREVRPTVLFGVPRVWERIHTAVSDRLRTAPALRRGLARWALAVGGEAARREASGWPLGGWLALRRRVADRLVLGRVRERLGFDRLRIAASGAAPIRGEVLSFFAALGVRILEVYGLSESCGPATWNRPDRYRFGTVGPALPGVEVRLADDGEVLVRGPNVFRGYLGEPEATAESLREGWLHTGDLGSLDGDGFLTITGRKKEILITSGGKNVAPAGIEAPLKELELVSEAVVIGDDRRFLSALLVLEPEAAARVASSPGAGPLHEDPAVLAELERGVETVNRRRSRVESVRAFRVLPRALTVEDGELTPTLKVRRQVVEERWRELIEEMYAG